MLRNSGRSQQSSSCWGAAKWLRSHMAPYSHLKAPVAGCPRWRPHRAGVDVSSRPEFIGELSWAASEVHVASVAWGSQTETVWTFLTRPWKSPNTTSAVSCRWGEGRCSQLRFEVQGHIVGENAQSATRVTGAGVGKQTSRRINQQEQERGVFKVCWRSG